MVSIRRSGIKTTRMAEWKCDFTTAHAIQFYVRGARCVLKASAKLGTHQEQPALALGIHGGITSKEVANVLETAAEGLGYDGTRFSTHSIKIGGGYPLHLSRIQFLRRRGQVTWKVSYVELDVGTKRSLWGPTPHPNRLNTKYLHHEE
ncbi:hypothetical protein PHMEG_00021218 [Phytophthora megakarya]|uniref:Uncharacterized protein n=1 Tax=Phytophthora megakarya TaxID=4795 RepID=A0A225VPP6_9STRA|nr:hypothetical protein PHMEG_00021218 [Phytophthora megakarya]